MGEELLQFYRTRLKKEYKSAFTFTFFCVLIIHLYKFVNTLPCHDSVYNYYSSQNMLGSGRWALSLACGMTSYFDLPWVIGLFSCVFIAMTVVVIVALFQLKNPILIGLIGALFAASPATTETFFFLYTADGYMIAMFLAAMAVYFSKIEEKRFSKWILSGVCICVSCGIYQAYVSFALLLAVCYFIDGLLQNKYSKQVCFKWILCQAALYITSLSAYYIIWKLCMYFSGTVATDYQGISEVGKISLDLLISGVLNSLKSILFYFLQWNVLEHGFTLYSVLSILFVMFMTIGLIVSCMKSGIFKRKWAVGLLIFSLLVIVPFAGIWHFVSKYVYYRAMMLQCLTLLFVLTALFYERWGKTLAKNAICIFLIMIIMNNALMANISYFYMNLCYERTYAEGVEMMIKIHELQDKYEFEQIAVVGIRTEGVAHKPIDTETGKMLVVGKFYILSGLLENTLLYDSEHVTRFLKTTFGLDIEPLERSQRNELLNTAKVRAMGSWPAEDSIDVIDNILIIKLSDDEE